MNNPYPTGQCTWWAWQAALYLQKYGLMGNAMNWIIAAKELGLPTGSTPVAGATMVLQPGVEGASSFGHVAHVTSVNGRGFNVTQMDVPDGNPNMTVGSYTVGDGCEFILPPTEDDDMKLALLTRNDGSPDPEGPGAVYLCVVDSATGIPVTKRHVVAPEDEAYYTVAGLAVNGVTGYLLDRAILGPSVQAGVYPSMT